MQIQLDFFEQKNELEILQEEFRKVKESSDKVRKGIFAKHGELSKMYLDISNRLAILERYICKNER